MIKIVMVKGEDNVIGFSDLDDEKKYNSIASGFLAEELDRVSVADSVVLGDKTFPAYGDWVIANYEKVYVCSLDSELSHESDKVIFVQDFMKLVEEYQFSDKVLAIGGGKTIYDLFTPYAKEIVFLITDSGRNGDLVYDKWESLNTELVKSEEWEGGKTMFYEVKGEND